MSPFDTFILQFPHEVQVILNSIRTLVHQVCPEVTEKMAYGIPTFVYHGNLVHMSAYKKHIGFYPGADGIAAFESELQDYVHAKGSVQFPLNKPIPYALIQRMIEYRVQQNTR